MAGNRKMSNLCCEGVFITDAGRICTEISQFTVSLNLGDNIFMDTASREC